MVNPAPWELIHSFIKIRHCWALWGSLGCYPYNWTYWNAIEITREVWMLFWEITGKISQRRLHNWKTVPKLWINTFFFLVKIIFIKRKPFSFSMNSHFHLSFPLLSHGKTDTFCSKPSFYLQPCCSFYFPQGLISLIITSFLNSYFSHCPLTLCPFNYNYVLWFPCINKQTKKKTTVFQPPL